VSEVTARSPVLEALGRLYERRQVGRTGASNITPSFLLSDVLNEAGPGWDEGEDRELALRQLREAETAGLLKLVPSHRRDRDDIYRIHLSPANEAALFSRIGRSSPTERRLALSAQFTEAANAAVPDRWRESWQAWCERMSRAARTGSNVAPFDAEPSPHNDELLALLPKLLSWEGESLVRFASCVLCGTSKRLEELAAKGDGEFSDRLRGKLGRVLEDITGGTIRTLDDLGILPNPRSVLVHGPLRLGLDGDWLDLGLLRGAFRLSQVDIERALTITTTARRCLTVENETSFHELAKLGSGNLLVQTSYPGSATIALLRRLGDTPEFWHFGDSDDAGFEILRVLCDKSGRRFRPLHMERGRTPPEQESFGRPTLTEWPFYIE
jgi:hypothetical protein